MDTRDVLRSLVLAFVLGHRNGDAAAERAAAREIARSGFTDAEIRLALGVVRARLEAK